MKRWATGILIGVLAVGVAGAAHADPGDGTYSPEQLAESIMPLDDGIVPYERRIEPVDTVERTGEETTVTLKADILFDFASASISDDAVQRIGEIVEPIPDGARVVVAGHTDAIGTDSDNLALSKQRAQTVADAITAARPDLKLSVEGYGETRPVADNQRGGEDNPEGRALNRRVEIQYEE